MEKHALWREELRVKSYEADAHGVLKPHSLFSYFTEVAGNHATHLGYGYHDLQHAGYFWVLSRILVEVDRMPRWDETVYLETWPKGVEKLFALRDFLMTGRGGETLVSATSAWLLLDTGRSRPHKIDVLPAGIPIRAGVHAIPSLPEKLGTMESLAKCAEHRVMPSDLDVNNHVNNAEYIRWIADCAGGGGTPALSSLQVNYLDEALLDDTVELSLGKETDRLWRVEGTSRIKGSKLFQARVAWGS